MGSRDTASAASNDRRLFKITALVDKLHQEPELGEYARLASMAGEDSDSGKKAIAMSGKVTEPRFLYRFTLNFLSHRGVTPVSREMIVLTVFLLTATNQSGPQKPLKR